MDITARPLIVVRPLAWPRVVAELAAVVGLAFAAFVAFALIGSAQDRTDPFFPLADAFLHGRTYMYGDFSWLELVPRIGAGWYVPFPPVPAVLALPVVIVTGSATGDTGIMAAAAGAVAVVLMYGCLARLGLEFRARLALAAAFAFGSELAWSAGEGGPHLYAEVLGATFLLGALLLGLHRRAPIAAGLLLALGAGCRLPVAFALPVILFLYRGDRFAWAQVVVGVLPVALAIAGYNVSRFGSPFDFGYARIVDVAGHRVTDEPWYADGIVSLSYIPRGIYTMLLTTFGFSDQPPWLIPAWSGQGILLTMPALAWIGRSRWRDPVVRMLAVGAVLVMLPDWMHGETGYAQFGYRFILDALPLLWLMLGLVVARSGLTRGLAAALGLGVAMYAYGFLAIYGLNIVRA